VPQFDCVLCARRAFVRWVRYLHLPPIHYEALTHFVGGANEAVVGKREEVPSLLSMLLVLFFVIGINLV
jgi:hypothetical protein